MRRALASCILFLTACASVDGRVDRLIEALRDPDPDRRDQAEAELRELGPRADAALRAHLDDVDSEVASRCRRLLDARITDAEWYETASISGLDLQWVTYQRLQETGSDEEKHDANVWFRTLQRLATNHASRLLAANQPDGWRLDGLDGLYFGSDFLMDRLAGDGGGPAKLDTMYDEACARDDDPTLLALALDVAGRKVFDLELRFGIRQRRGLLSGPSLHFRRRAEIFREHWQPWHHDIFRPR